MMRVDCDLKTPSARVWPALIPKAARQVLRPGASDLYDTILLHVVAEADRERIVSTTTGDAMMNWNDMASAMPTFRALRVRIPKQAQLAIGIEHRGGAILFCDVILRECPNA